MAKLRNISDDILEVRVVGVTVAPDEVVDVPDDVFAQYVWPETLWAVVSRSKSTKKDED